MTSSTPILPTLLCLALGGVGLLWLAEPSRVGAAPAGGSPARTEAFASASPLARPAPPRSPAIRWPGATALSETPPAAPPSAAQAQAFDPAQVEAFRRGLAERRERARQERQVARERAEDAWFSERAGRLATELALPAGAARALAELYVEERDRQSEVWARMRALDSREEARRLLREEMGAVFEWRAAELVRRFGAEDAARIEAAENADLSEER